MLLWIVMPLTRRDRLAWMAEQIATLEVGEYKKQVVIVCDNPRITLHEIRRVFKDFGQGIQPEVLRTKWVSEPSSHDTIQRRARITEVWSIIKKYLTNKQGLVLGIEDDGNFKKDSFLKLLETYRDKFVNGYCKVGFVSGIEAGRWGHKMLGAWRRSAEGIMSTVPFKESGIEQVHAAGFYFFVSDCRTISSVKDFRHTFFGPDVNFGLDLSDAGYFNFIDYSVKLGHDNGVRVIQPDNECVVLEYKQENDRVWRRVNEKSVNDIGN